MHRDPTGHACKNTMAEGREEWARDGAAQRGSMWDSAATVTGNQRYKVCGRIHQQWQVAANMLTSLLTQHRQAAPLSQLNVSAHHSLLLSMKESQRLLSPDTATSASACRPPSPEHLSRSSFAGRSPPLRMTDSAPKPWGSSAAAATASGGASPSESVLLSASPPSMLLLATLLAVSAGSTEASTSRAWGP